MSSRFVQVATAVGLLVARSLLGQDFQSLQVVPNGLGVNIHFTEARPGELEQLAAGGFKVIRMDLSWAQTEKNDGAYDFSHYDTLLRGLDQHRLRALLILDYAHPKHDHNLSPYTEEGRAAFVKWALAAVEHFQGRGVLWEMYNEPNGFWRPKLVVEDYIKLALAVGKAMRERFPGEIYVGPASSGVELPLLEACFKAGLLEYFAAVTVHPYRQSEPESAAEDYRKLRLLIARYTSKPIPIFSGEWGYSTAWRDFDPEKQGKYLARQWLCNLANDVNLSIWYDWHDDGTDPKEAEHHFGTVLHGFHPGRPEPYDAKPAYLAARTLTAQLSGYRFNKRLALQSTNDYLLLFARGEDIKLVAWTTAKGPKEAMLRCGPAEFSAVSHTGEALAGLKSERDATVRGGPFLRLTLTDAPQYLTPRARVPALLAAAKWKRLPLEVVVKAPATVDLEDNSVRAVVPFDEMTGVTGSAWQRSHPVRVTRGQPRTSIVAALFPSQDSMLSQQTTILVTNPLTLTPLAATAEEVVVRVSNQGEAFDGLLRIQQPSMSTFNQPVAVHFAAGDSVRRFPHSRQPNDDVYHLLLMDSAGQQVFSSPDFRCVSVDAFGPGAAARYKLQPDGDSKVRSEQSLAEALAPEPWLDRNNLPCLRLRYRFWPGWKFIMLRPAAASAVAIPGKPKSLGLWVYGDGSGNAIRLRFQDAAGQTYQADGERLSFKGWKHVALPMNKENGASWGGPHDGQIHYPIRWESLFLLDHVAGGASEGAVYLAEPSLIYDVGVR